MIIHERCRYNLAVQRSSAGEVWSMAFQCLVGIALLYRELGPACFGGVGVIVLTIPLSGVVGGGRGAEGDLPADRLKLRN